MIELTGIIITLAVSIFAYIKAKQDKNRFTYIIALLTINATLLISLRFELLPGLESKGILPSELYSDQVSLDMAKELIRSNKKINELNNSAFDNLYQNRLFEFQNYISSIKNGIFTVSKEEIGDFSTELIQKANKSIIATSYIKKSKWWDTPWGKEYEEINYSLIKKGIKITRYFIFSNKEEFNNSKAFIEKQKEHGIQVYYILANAINGDYNQDVILIDDKIGGKLLLNPDKGMTKAEMIIDEKNLHEIRKIINQLKNSVIQ